MGEQNPVHLACRSEKNLVPTKLDQIAHVIDGEMTGASSLVIDRICTDSRGASPGALFIALKGQQADGHRFLSDAFRNGATAALIAQDRRASLALEPTWPVIVVPDPLRALQALARWHRRKYFERVLAITGSNGKTIVKDALKGLLAGRQFLTSPGSYNSQLGLPLAVLSAEKPEPLAILEAGISAPGEMAALEEIARPSYGILTNIGLAHFAAFGSREAIAREKMKLFERIPTDGWLLLPGNEPTLTAPLKEVRCPVHRLGDQHHAVSLTPASLSGEGQRLELSIREQGSRSVLVKTR